MTALTAWSGGSLGGGTTAFFPAFNAADMNSLANLASVLSSILQFDNTAGANQFMDVSFTGAIAASSTIAAGAGLAFFLACLEADNSTIGDGRMTAGTQVASTTYTPMNNPIGGIPIAPGTAITNIAGCLLGVTLPPRKFALIMQNQTGFALAAGGVCSCQISTYRQNTNA
jgi:hypothetical protein